MPFESMPMIQPLQMPDFQQYTKTLKIEFFQPTLNQLKKMPVFWHLNSEITRQSNGYIFRGELRTNVESFSDSHLFSVKEQQLLRI